MNPRVLIADDEAPARDRLRQMLGRIGCIDIIAEAADGNEALRQIEALQPDIAILDINMPGIDGLRVLEALDDPPAVIFSTAHEHHAVRAFELDAVDYLLKPYSADRLRRAIDRARRLLAPTPEQSTPVGATAPRIPALDGRATVLVPTDDIVALRIVEGAVFLHRIDNEQLICETGLADLETTLPPGRFLRISRQAIVNLAHVLSFEPEGDGALRVTLARGLVETVSRRRAPHFRQALRG